VPFVVHEHQRFMEPRELSRLVTTRFEGELLAEDEVEQSARTSALSPRPVRKSPLALVGTTEAATSCPAVAPLRAINSAGSVRKTTGLWGSPSASLLKESKANCRCCTCLSRWVMVAAVASIPAGIVEALAIPSSSSESSSSSPKPSSPMTKA
jgi:hypothetical protein